MVTALRRMFTRDFGPIGVDFGSRSIKLVQFSRDGERLIDAARWDLPVSESDKEVGTQERTRERLVEGLRRVREGRHFRGKKAVICLNGQQLFLQNMRVPKNDIAALAKHVQQEAAARMPFPAAEAEIQYLDAADVRQADTVVREVIVMACHRPVLKQALDIVEAAGLYPMAVDIEPAAWVRSFVMQYRREEDRKQRSMFVHVGYGKTGIAILQNDDIYFMKYIDIGGRQFDEALSKHLNMTLPEAATLRRRNGDRRTEQQDSEIARTFQEALRPVLERLAAELSMCIRYHSVTFRGQPITRILIGGGEASPGLQDVLQKRLDVKCELSDPLRNFSEAPQAGHKGQWDVATGLALRFVS